jgi:DNA-binding YbaB/EbfC family protein
MGSGFAKKKKEARLLQEKFSEMQEKLKDSQVTGSAGGGLVEITLNGEHEMVKIKLNKECVDPDDIEGLEDLILTAYKEASKKANALSDKVLPGMGSGFPGMPGFGL